MSKNELPIRFEVDQTGNVAVMRMTGDPGYPESGSLVVTEDGAIRFVPDARSPTEGPA